MTSVELHELVSYLDKELEIDSVADYCQNGLQVEGTSEVAKAAFVLDVTLETIKKAKTHGCDIMISHHGLIWKPVPAVTGILSKRLKELLRHDISVYVGHLPIDKHKKYSHSLLVAERLGLHGLSPFGKSKKAYFGFSGHLPSETTAEELKKTVDAKLQTDCKVHFPRDSLSNIGIVSGTGGFCIEEAYQRGINCILIGDIKYSDLLTAKDYGITVIEAGHFETERWGMEKLAQVVAKKFKIESLFLES